MDMQGAIRTVTERQDLTAGEMEQVMRTIMTGEATPAQIGGFLIGLRMKGETVDEITAAAKVMRDLAAKINADGEFPVDTCGTGGDASGTFNISTASAIVAAAAGCTVAKHGNRSVSSKSGSADLLEKAGLNLSLKPEQVEECINQCGIGFLFAPNHHGAMKHAIGPRKEMGARTIFNILGPLTNPAGAPNQVLGVFCRSWVLPLAQVLNQLGSRHVLIVNAEDGLDEISISSPTSVAELKDGQITEYSITPEQFNLNRAPIDDIKAVDSDASLNIINSVFNGDKQGKFEAATNIITLNAGAAIYVSGKAESLKQGIELAAEVIANGKAKDKLTLLIQLTQKI
ncbi:MAG: anthranilate phosphoribosyltransferase [Gammaproteobacteria bacterium]|nr:MAG: anthranilate phosphoribosyltransferase [Gammaproteobacteria bacterium]